MTAVNEKRLMRILLIVLAVLVVAATYMGVLAYKSTRGDYINAIWEKPRS